MINDSNSSQDSTDAAVSMDTDEEPLIVEIRIPTESFALGETPEAISNARVEFDQLVPTDRTLLLYLWFENGSTDFETVAATDSSVECTRHVITFDRRCRHAVSCLRNYEGPITLADLADEVAVRENEKTLTEIPATEVKRIYLSLYHSHVPKLEDADIADYSQDEDLIELLPGAREPGGE